MDSSIWETVSALLACVPAAPLLVAVLTYIWEQS